MKKTLLLLVLALSLVLSGCSLVVKDPAVDARQVILARGLLRQGRFPGGCRARVRKRRG